LTISKEKLPLIARALSSAAVLLGVTSGLIALIFMSFYETSFKQALIHAIPLSIISSAIAIPSVKSLEHSTREFVVYESTFSDVLGIIFFNIVLTDHTSGWNSLVNFSWELTLIFAISILSTSFLIFLLNHSASRIRFFLVFAILILTYSVAKSWHLPSLILVLIFGLVLNNFGLLDYRITRKVFNFERISEISREIRLMTIETAFIIRTFFFLLFGYSINLALLANTEVMWVGALIIAITLLLRFLFLRYFLRIYSASLMLITPRGLITILLFYSIPVGQRMEKLSEGVLFIVIGFTAVMMTVGLLIDKETAKERMEEII
jgi:Kef-type K+ transport system membrane component KefB